MSSLARRRWLTGGIVVFIMSVGMAPGFGQVAVVPEAQRDFISAVSPSDVEALSEGPSSPTGTGRPPRIGPNVVANAPQAASPNGLLGRSETTIAATDDGQFLVAGWNDAQGFCGRPFGTVPPDPNACTPQSPPGLSGYAFSTDGGLTWTDGGAPPVINHVFTRGDPWLDRGGFDRNTFFYANLAVDDRDANVSFGVSVHRGSFAGGSFSWSDVRTFDSPHNSTLCTNPGPPGNEIPCDFYDKEALAAAKDGSGTAYVSLTNFQGQRFIGPPPGCGILAQFGFGQIEVWRTHDGGDTWQGPAIAGPEAADSVTSCGNSGTLQQSSAPAIGPNGEVYVVWQFGPTFTATTSTDADIVFARSFDGGVTFDPPVKVDDINSIRQNPPVGYNRDRINDHPRIAVAQGGRFRGRIYVVYYSAASPVTAPPATAASCLTPVPSGTRCRPQTLVSSQIFLRYSDDHGATWSGAIPLGGLMPDTGVKRFWPVVSVEPGGNVDVVYYESREVQATLPDLTDVECNVNVGGRIRRQGFVSSLVDTFWIRSTDGGLSFGAPRRVSTETSNWCTAASNIRPNFGDYIGSASGGNRVFGFWADSRNGVPDSFYSTGLGAGKSTP